MTFLPDHLNPSKEQDRSLVSVKDRLKTLEQEQEKLSTFKENIDRIGEYSQKVMRMLDEFDQRVTKLEESSLRQLHEQTQNLSTISSNIGNSLLILQGIVSDMDVFNLESNALAKEPDGDELEPFLKALKHVKEALERLQASQLPGCQRAIGRLTNLHSKGISLLDARFRRILSECSQPLQLEGTENLKDNPNLYVDSDIAEKLMILALGIQSALGNDAREPAFVKSFIDIRCSYISKTLEPLQSSLVLFETRGPYIRGGHPFPAFSSNLFLLLKAEYSTCQRILPEPHPVPALNLIVKIAMQLFQSLGESIINRAKRGHSSSPSKLEGGEMFVILDIAENLNALAADIEKEPFAESIINAASLFTEAASSLLSSYVSEIIASSKATTSLPGSGTVHEVTTSVLGFMRRLLDYENVITEVYSTSVDSASIASSRFDSEDVDTTNFIVYIVEVVDALEKYLEAKSKLYKKASLSNLFLMNNYCHICKILKSSKYGEILAKECERINRMTTKQKQFYLICWIELADHFNENIMAKGSIKERLKNFVVEFEDLMRVNRSYSVPDADLRTKLIQDINEKVVGSYRNFASRNQSALASNAKLVKYDVESVAAMLSTLFEA